LARENRRHREEKKFGKAERFADIICATPPESWRCIPPTSEARAAIARLRGELPRLPIIDASNVMDYYAAHEQQEWDYDADTPCAAPSFVESWIEMRCPDVILTAGGPDRRAPNHPEMVGFRISAADVSGKPIPWCSAPGINRLDILLQDVRWVLRVQTLACIDRRPLWVSCYRSLPVSATGRVVALPIDIHAGLDGIGLSPEQVTQLVREFAPAFMPLLLTLSFLNCKNVPTVAHEPDRALNRVRRRAGHEPFLRYHTIDIEPMKRILRTEGQVETQGLKKALHIVRGHFATYTEERPLFGKVAGTFWVPVHVRGSAKEGVVVSDYRVHAPESGVSS
jgi:hypothetical protein